MTFTKEEFFAYLLLYAAQADFVETAKEKAYILNKVSPDVYGKVHRIFDKDSDSERLEVLLENVRRHNYKQANPQELLDEIKAVMAADGAIDATEKMYLIGIRRLIMSA